ncbi:hypothetical protein GF314_05715 [bacterium]|nr:hypothetical protein [bacterium]
MPATTTRPPAEPRYRGLFPSWDGARPLGWYFAEQMLEARAESDFPTNAAGHDEDVNLYMIALLRAWVDRDSVAGILPGVDPLVQPLPRTWSRRRRAEHWRRQADHRLLALGLFDRGDLARRRKVGYRFTAAEMHARDVTVMVRGYATAATLVADRPDLRGLATVWRKLADHGPDYVHVLQTLARRRFGLGARLGDDELERLLASA